jgi:hypothetical protein
VTRIPSATALKAILEQAWLHVLAEEPSLFDYGRPVERPLVARLAHYLSNEIENVDTSMWRGLTVDVDLHVGHGGMKPGVDENAQYGQPDLVIHERATNARNILVLEAKCNTNPTAGDMAKLDRIARQLGYRYTISVRLGREPLDLHSLRRHAGTLG